jgi:ATP phosphoribosyltransferase regulatory subunit
MQFLQLSEELNYFKSKYEITKELENVAITSGYTLFEPEFFESYDKFVHMNKRVKTQSLVKLLDADGSILILRPDITTSVIKRVIPKWQVGSTLRLFYLSTIFSRSQQGSIDERKQFGMENLGTDQRTADVEIIKLVIQLLKRFKISFLLEISNSRFLSALITDLGLNQEDEKTFKEILYYKNRAALNQWIEKTNISANHRKLIENILNLQGTLIEIQDTLKAFQLTKPMEEALLELEILVKSLDSTDLIKYIKIDLTVLSQYDYYDGLMFKAYVPSISVPILSGGRYDPLTRNYGQQVPAIGFTLNTSDLIKEVIESNE